MSSEENISNPRKSSGSSSLSRSSSNDLFQVDTVKLNLTNSEDEQNDVSSDSSAKSEVDNTFPSHASSFDVSNMTHNEMDMSPTQSPPVQVMDRSAGYDSYRIPSSVFATNKSSSLIEWSIASNESLFSLHLGNNSFSTDSASKFDELTKSGEFNVFSPPQLVMREDTDTSKESVETEDSKTFEMGEAFKVEEKASEDHKEVKNSHSAMTPSFSHYTSPSNESRHSEQSFAFPM
ncbi:hypothetical protein L6164_027019 [Bauhinia variegata]|uniref:Uncharacterized protein n=1 Tax=Bauhinia variegata TaxID=167791 RepID=A0ACB9LS24_BAUVA|nr:hypothetical protein L6164_027019 [Bauhinia variegata]